MPVSASMNLDSEIKGTESSAPLIVGTSLLDSVKRRFYSANSVLMGFVVIDIWVCRNHRPEKPVLNLPHR